MHNTKSNHFEDILALHSAPSLLGIKPANLFSLKKVTSDIHREITTFNRKAAAKGLKIRVMCECDNRVLVLLYNKKLMEKQLFEPERQSILSQYGYPDTASTDTLLSVLSERIIASETFPHEIGVFLGYPVHDINGFIDNCGSDYKFCGYWKVYADEEKTKRLFENYKKCSTYLCQKLYEGQNLYEALKIS